MAKARKKTSTGKRKMATETKRNTRVVTKRSKIPARATATVKKRKKKSAVPKKTKAAKGRPKRPARAKRSTAASRAYAIPPKFVESGEDLEMSPEGEGMPAGIPAVGS